MRLETERLVLREWRDSDKPLYAAIVGDPEVRRYFESTATLADAIVGIDRATAQLAEVGFSFLAVEVKADGALIGMLGMAPIKDTLRALLPDAPGVEIGWLLAKSHWGQGLAPEGARAVLDFAWNEAGLPEVGACTYRGNLPSRRVMEKLGMRYDAGSDFDHPDIEAGHPVRPHVLYRISNPKL